MHGQRRHAHRGSAEDADVDLGQARNHLRLADHHADRVAARLSLEHHMRAGHVSLGASSRAKQDEEDENNAGQEAKQAHRRTRVRKRPIW